eukprot:198714-Amphidinium_carterae.2
MNTRRCKWSDPAIGWKMSQGQASKGGGQQLNCAPGRTPSSLRSLSMRCAMHKQDLPPETNIFELISYKCITID